VVAVVLRDRLRIVRPVRLLAIASATSATSAAAPAPALRFALHGRLLRCCWLSRLRRARRFRRTFAVLPMVARAIMALAAVCALAIAVAIAVPMAVAITITTWSPV
jgi:hypothetical protein